MSGTANHQTVRIARGRHASPADGACVMELASMLAGERFSDRPRCVDPVIGAFLRAYNDRLGYVRRQGLYPFAARAVGTRRGRRLTRRRRDLCLAWAGLLAGDAGTVSRRLALWRARAWIALVLGVAPALRLGGGAGIYAARRAVASDDHDGALALLDALLRESADAPADTWGELVADMAPKSPPAAPAPAPARL